MDLSSAKVKNGSQIQLSNKFNFKECDVDNQINEANILSVSSVKYNNLIGNLQNEIDNLQNSIK